MTDVARLEACVRDGAVAVFPADGLYGLACDPSNRTAIERIDALKGRAGDKPSAVMFFAPLGLREVLAMSGPRTRETIAALLPGPVTLVVDNPGGLYPLACREDRRRLGIRLIGGHLEGARCAVLQTSANRSGEPAPARLEEVDERVLEAADLAIDGGALAGEPSTVVDVTAVDSGGEWRLLREGALAAPEVAQALRGLGRATGTRG
jgi:L-threonylcarbamoyladenylate synthase